MKLALSTRIKIELMLTVQVLLTVLLLANITVATPFPEIMRGGNTGAVFCGLSLMGGFLGWLFFLINILCGFRTYWSIRALIVVFGVLSTGQVGAMIT